MAAILAPAPPRARARAHRSGGTRMGRVAALFLLPFFALFLAFTISPIVYSMYLSLFSEQAGGLGLGAKERVFVGADNFVRAFQDSSFFAGFINIGLYCLIYIPIMIGLALTIALLLDSAVAKAKGFLRLAFYMPSIVPGLIAAIIWVYLYTPGVSPLVDIFESTGATWDLSTRLAALLSLSNISLWLHTGYNVILFYAALQAVPREVIEAASIDGSGPVRTALQIKARMISSAVGIAVLFTVVGALQLFAEVLPLRGRATAINSTWTPNLFIYQAAFERHDFGYAAATAIIFAFIIGAMSWAITRIQSKVQS